MIIGVCGFGFTGSGAVLDYLKGFDELCVNEKIELGFLYDPDGILDLERSIVTNPIRFFSADASIKKFRQYMLSYELTKYMKRTMSEKAYRKLIENYIQSITKTEWSGFWHFDKRRISKFAYIFKYQLGWKYLRIFDKLNYPIPSTYPNNSKMRIPVSSKIFIEQTIKFVRELLNRMGAETDKDIVLDQPFPVNCPQIAYHLFNDSCKSIIVNRDPRDLYIFVKKYARLDANFIPYETCDSFIDFYNNQMSICNFDHSILNIYFEDMIYNFDATVNCIHKFVGLDKTEPMAKFFDKNKSIGNTQLFKKHLEYKEDIAKIERELSGYLYDFDKYNVDEIKAKPFLYTI